MDLSMNRRMAMVLLALSSLLVIAAVACGGDDDGDGGSSVAATAKPAEAAAPAATAKPAEAGGTSDSADAAAPAATVAANVPEATKVVLKAQSYGHSVRWKLYTELAMLALTAHQQPYKSVVLKSLSSTTRTVTQ